MLTHYLQVAMHRAIYKILDDDGTFFGEIPDLPGVYANADTLEACRDELQEVLEGWILLGIHLQHHMPVWMGLISIHTFSKMLLDAYFWSHQALRTSSTTQKTKL